MLDGKGPRRETRDSAGHEAGHKTGDRPLHGADRPRRIDLFGWPDPRLRKRHERGGGGKAHLEARFCNRFRLDQQHNEGGNR